MSLDYTDLFGDAFQRHLLAVLARTPGMVVRYRTALSHEYFTSDLLRAVTRALLAYSDEFQHLPLEATLVQCARELLQASQQASVEPFVRKLFLDDISDAVGVAHKAVTFGQYAALVNAVLASADKVAKIAAAQQSVVEQGKAVKAIIEKALLVGKDVSDLGVNYIATASERAQRYLSPALKDLVIPTGIRHVDDTIGGGLGRGCLGTVISPTGIGKTTFLASVGGSNLMTTAKLCVVHISMEMSADDVARKYDDRILGSVSYVRSRTPDRLEELLLSRIRRFCHGTLFIKQYSTRSAGVTDFRNYLDLLRAHGYHPDLVLVDYADIVEAESRKGEVRHEQAGIYEDLRKMAQDYNCAVWTASQVNRSGVQKMTHQLSDIAESFEKIAIVDVGLTLSQGREENIEQRCRIFVAKCRSQRDRVVVECEIRRDRALIRSIGRYDESYNALDEDSPPSFSKKFVERAAAQEEQFQSNRGGNRPQFNGASRRVGPQRT